MSDLDFKNNDMNLNSDLKMVSGVELTRQNIWLKLATFKGEYFLNTEIGIDYFKNVLIKNPSLASLTAFFRNEIQSVKGVKTVSTIQLSLDKKTRTLSVFFEVISNTNDVIKSDFSLGV
jgi:hypothetical protein